jgi:hypothetical protein
MLLQLISRARRRLFCNALAAEAARAVLVATAVLILLLLLGTDILSWRWLIAMPAATFAAGAFLAARRLPGSYDAARIVDHRMRLSDTLSTALFCERADSRRRFDLHIRHAQRSEAEAAAARVRAADAIPMRAPRLLYAAVPLALVAGTLFLLRYSWQDHLDLRQPVPAVASCLLRLSHLDLAPFGDREARKRHQTAAEEASSKSAAGKPEGSATKAEAKPEQSASQQPAPQPVPQPGTGNSGTADRQAGNQQQQGGQQNAQNAGDRQGGESGSAERQASDSGRQDGNSAANSSLMGKLSDAVRDMLSRLRSPSDSGRNGRQGRGNTASRQGQAGNRQSGGQNGAQPGEGTQSAEAAQQGNGKGGRQGAAKIASAHGGNTAEKQPGSSAGSNDGFKDLREAEQLAAMGKLSVIFGKRAESVTGSTTVETFSGDQTIATPYAAARDAHTGAIDAIDRDEVPVGLEDYVQRYFAAIRGQKR